MKPEAPESGYVWFGGFNFPYKTALTHTIFLGATGSGKTISQRLLYQSVLSELIGKHGKKKGDCIRALMYDAKGDLISILVGMGIKDIVTFNPFDIRGDAWNMAKDIQDEATALEVAHILIPEREESQPFFRQAARDILSGVITAYLYERPLEWTLKDVLFPLLHKDSKVLKNVLELSEFSEDRLQYFEHKETFENIRSTIRTELKPLQLIASMWHQAHLKNKTFSLSEWIISSKVLILGNSYKLRESLKRLNQIIFKRASQLLLDLPELQSDEYRMSWVCLDELQQLGELDGLTDLLTNGRSKGVAMVLGCQDFDSLKDIYGEELANVIFAQCANRAIFRLGSGSSAKWASENFGEKERFENTNSKGTSYNWETGTTTSEDVSEKVEKREAVLSQEFLTIPMTTPENGLTGYYVSPYIKDKLGVTFIKRKIKGSDIANFLKPLADARVNSEYNQRPKEHQKTISWTKEEFEKFGASVPNKIIGEPKEISKEEALDNWRQSF